MDATLIKTYIKLYLIRKCI